MHWDERFIFSCLCFAVLLFLPSAAFAAEDEYVFILGARGNPYWTAMADGIKKTADAEHIKAIIYQTETDSDAQGQLNICLTAAERKPKILAMQSINVAVGISCFKQATAAGIAVADLDAHLSVEQAAANGIKLTFTIGSDNYLIGREAAKFAAKIVEKESPKILVLEGSAGSVTSRKRVDGFVSGMKALIPDTKIVASISAEWDRLKALNVTTDLLEREPDLDLIYAANDMMALGAVEAVRTSGRSSVKIIGVDGTADARKAIQSGKLTASVAQLPYLMGIRAVELALAARRGEVFKQIEITPTPVLTAEFLRSEGRGEVLLNYIR